jgi:CheY-like chemotaxis protein
VLFQADVALGDCAAGSYPEEELRSIHGAALRGSEIVRQLMIYSGKESSSDALVDLSTIVEEMLVLLKVSVTKHASLEAHLNHGLPEIRANAAQLRQLVMNLVTNASDAIGDRDGVIRVETKVVEIGGRPHVQLEVSDTGCGMTPEVQARVFDPFFTTKSAGHGMGLAIVQGIVRGLDGVIHLVSEPGKGTTFRIAFCAAEIPTAVTNGPLRAAEQFELANRDAAVLVVEDEALLRQALAKMLRQTGFEVFEAADGSSAIELLRAHHGRIAVILLDVTIPGASPSEIVAVAEEIVPDVSVVLTSAYSEQTIDGTASAPQVRAFIRKPFPLAKLLQTLEKVLVDADKREGRAAGSGR